jgi:hypothetical protein
MSVIYSGQTILNTTIDGSTQTNFNQALVNALISAGWSLVQSGSSNGIWRVRSAATPQGLQGDLWLYNGTATSGTAPAILEAASMISTTNVGTSSYQNQSPVSIACGTGFTYTLIATGFYFYLFRTTIPCPAQSSFFWCVPYLPSNLTGLISSFIIAYGSTGGNDTIGSTGMFGSPMSGAFSYLNGAGHTGSSAWNFWGIVQLAISGGTITIAAIWFDGSVEFYEPRVMAYQTSSSGGQTGNQRACGYMWDALVLNQALPRGTTISYDSGTWMAISENTTPTLLIKIA